MVRRANLTFTISIGVIVAASLYTAFEARETTQLAHTSYIASHRAFVSVTKLDVRPAYNPSDPKQLVGWTFAPVAENSGPTPTRSLTILTGAQVAADSDSLGPKDPEVAFPNRNPVRMLVGPRSTVILPVTSSSNLLIANDVIQKVASGQTDAFVFGTIHYHDVFEHTLRHITKFCFQIGAEGDGLASNKVGYHFCPFWNCADYECVTDKAEHERAELRPPKAPN